MREEAQFETLEQTIARLDVTVKPCEKHNNAARIEVTDDGEWLLAEPCGCVMLCSQFDSMEDAIAFWNLRPYVDDLMSQYMEEVSRNLNLTHAYRLMRSRAENMANLLESMKKNNTVSIVDLDQCFRFVPDLLATIRLERKQEEESRQRMLTRLESSGEVAATSQE